MNNRRQIITNLVLESLLLESRGRGRGRRRDDDDPETVKQKVWRKAKEKIIRPLIAAAIDRETVYGMGGNQPVVGEYSGKQSQIV